MEKDKPFMGKPTWPQEVMEVITKRLEDKLADLPAEHMGLVFMVVKETLWGLRENKLLLTPEEREELEQILFDRDAKLVLTAELLRQMAEKEETDGDL